MAKTDGKPLPGDLVMLRGSQPRDVWAIPNSPNVTPEKLQRAGVVMPRSIGLVISAAHPDHHRFYTYVLWSMPCICGWIEDGFIRKA
jgi:hypothetical protein